jgi:transcriptional regulator with XRE-family HTH domain
MEQVSCNSFPCRKMGFLSYSAGAMATADQRFGAQLREWRFRRRLSQDKLGELIGSDGPRIHRLEKGEENPTLETLDKLANALDIDVGSFLIEPRPEQETGRESAGERREGSSVLDAVLARLDEEFPAEDSWQGDVHKAIAALNRALRRPPATGTSPGSAEKTGR